MTTKPRPKHDVPLLLGVENPLMDLLVPVADDFLQQHQLKKGQMHLVDQDRQGVLLNSLANHTVQQAAGGACANTMQTFALLGGNCAFIGCTGDDLLGKIFVQELAQSAVRCLISTHPTMKTGSAIVLITPDAERTMAVCLGASQALSPPDIPEEIFVEADWVYVSAYLWDSPSTKATVNKTLSLARKHGVSIALNLADPACVLRNKDALLATLKEKVQLIIGNLAEGQALTQQTSAYQTLKALPNNNLVALTMGSHGALIKDKQELIYLEASPVQAVDTTGAGDAFAAGFLFGLISGSSLFQAGQLGCTLAARVVSQMGPRLEKNLKKELRSKLPF